MIKFIRLALIVLCIAGYSSAAIAQEKPDLTQIQKELDTKQKELESFEPNLLDTALDDQKLFEARQNVKKLRARFYEIQTLIKPLNIRLEADIADIGPPPSEEGAEAEPENIKELREKLNKELLVLQGLTAQSEALGLKSTRFLERLAAIRRNQFVDKILEKNLSPFSNTFWSDTLRDKDQALQAISENWKAFFTSDSEKTKRFSNAISMSILVFLVIYLFVSIIKTISLRRKVKALTEPSLIQKLDLSGYAILNSLIAGFIGFSIIMFVVDAHGMITEANKLFVYKVFLLGFFIIYALTKSWMLFCAGAVRKFVSMLSVSSTLLYSIDFIFLETGRQLGIPVEIAIAQSFIVTSIFATLLLSFFLSLTKRKCDADQNYLLKRRMFYIGFAIGIFIIIANMLGYVALTRFIFEQAILLSNFIIAMIIIRAMIRPFLARIELFFQQASDKKDDHLLLFWLSLLVDIILIIISMPVIAAIIGVEWEGIKLLIIQAISGIKIGGITISLSSLATAIIVFFILLGLTRFFQRILGQKVLTKTRMAESVRLSIVQIVGYIGLTIALMVAISSVGFDLSNLALIAGALSVGIGFGLQSIVSNFVSGLILLFERPIKVGDWVVVSSGEGLVKKISVRATEIETFDRTSIIIPNSELISSSVKNWTLKDRIGRLVITVGVSYNADPHRVHDLLLEVAAENTSLVNTPAPSVHFKDFGDSALIFDLRVFLKNISEMYIVATALRLAIWDKLKEEGIEIPFPQRDLHIRSSDVSFNSEKPSNKKKSK